MDVIFDIDGTLADATHRLHHIIPDPNRLYEQPFRKDWETFLSDELVAKDAPIPQTWEILYSLIDAGNRVIFITGRPESQRQVTWDWLTDLSCPVRACGADSLSRRGQRFVLFMRPDGDRRPSHVVKGELLDRARMAGLKPVMAFEDRKEDAAMWREKGLLCLQVAEGDY